MTNLTLPVNSGDYIRIENRHKSEPTSLKTASGLEFIRILPGEYALFCAGSVPIIAEGSEFRYKVAPTNKIGRVRWSIVH